MKTVIYKVSGESLASLENGTLTPLSPERFSFVVGELQLLVDEGFSPLVVVGGGNIFRGQRASGFVIEGTDGDRAGMRATSINAELLAATARARGLSCEVMTRGDLGGTPWDTSLALAHLQEGTILFLAGGMGVPGMSSDYPAVFHAGEIRAEAVLVAKFGVEAVYTGDPRSDSRAQAIKTVTCTQALDAGLEFMDRTALEEARRLGVHLLVFSANSPGAAVRAIRDGICGTIVEPV